MSLVNDMLEDLDRRTRDGERARSTGLRAVQARRRSRRLAWTCLGLATLAACGIAAVAWIAGRPSAETAPARSASLPSAAIQPLPAVASAPPAPPMPSLASPEPTTTRAAPTLLAPGAAEAPPTSPAPPIAAQGDPASESPVAIEEPPTGGEPFANAAPPPSQSIARGGQVAARGEPIAPKRLADELVHEGAQLIAGGRLDAGLDAWRRALELDPTRAEVAARAARRLLAAQRPAEARVWIDRSRATRPDDPVLRELDARAWLAVAGPEAALRSLEPTLPPFEAAPGLHALRAALLQREGRHAEALEAYRALVTRAPGEGRAWFGLAVSAHVLGREAEARIAYHHALGDPSLPGALARHARRRLARGAARPGEDPS